MLIVLLSLIFVVFPLNIHVFKPMLLIHSVLYSIGDGKTVCLSGLDERNRLQCSSMGMLGFHFQFNDSFCEAYIRLCTLSYSWSLGTNVVYDTVRMFLSTKPIQNSTASNCNGENDVMCLNDVFIGNARCNEKIECLHGEDEYRCAFFCLPSFYRSQCQFYSDQITVVTHLNLANYRLSFHPIAVIKILTTFLFRNQTIDYYEFHVDPHIENENNYIKQGILFSLSTY